MNDNEHPVVLNYENFEIFYEDLLMNQFKFSKNAGKIMAAYLPVSEKLRRNVLTRVETADGIYTLLVEGKLEVMKYNGQKIIHKGNIETRIHDIVAKEQKEGNMDDTQVLLDNTLGAEGLAQFYGGEEEDPPYNMANKRERKTVYA
jgi:hypothetical protein